MHVAPVALVALAACTNASESRASRVVEPTPYAGVTSCGPSAPPPAHRDEPRLPEREPVPSFVAPRSVDIGAPRGSVVEGDLSGEVVNRTIHARTALFGACFVRAEQPRGMRVRAHFTILEDGTTAGIDIDGEIEAVDRCICDLVAAIQFPAIDARATVTYPFLYE